MACVSARSSISIGIDPAIFERFPKATVAFTLCDVEVLAPKGANAQPKAMERYLSALKQQSVQTLVTRGINSDNYLDQPVCRSWEGVFKIMGEEGRHSTIVNLLRRATAEAAKVQNGQKADLGKISSFVDLYNCVSMQTLTPMGALDLSKVDGDIQLRYGREGDTFTGLEKEAVTEVVKPEHVVYADRSSVLTHLWNYRDAAHACVPREGHVQILLFADQVEEGAGDAEGAILRAMEELHNIGGSYMMMDKLNASRPSVTIDLTRLSEHEVSLKDESTVKIEESLT